MELRENADDIYVASIQWNYVGKGIVLPSMSQLISNQGSQILRDLVIRDAG
jgi:hypothetical protein